MLSAINLDHQPPFETNKVKNEGLEWHLPPKLYAVKPPIPQQKPKLSLCIRRDPTHRAGILPLARLDDLMVR